MSYNSTLAYMQNLVQEQKTQKELESCQQQAKQLELEHIEETRKSKEAQKSIDWEPQPKSHTVLCRERSDSAQAEPLVDAGAVTKWTKPDDEKEFNLKLEALRQWMASKGLEPQGNGYIKINGYPKLKGYTKAKIYNELCTFSSAFHIAEATFNDFWKKQKLIKFK